MEHWKYTVYICEVNSFIKPIFHLKNKELFITHHWNIKVYFVPWPNLAITLIQSVPQSLYLKKGY